MYCSSQQRDLPSRMRRFRDKRRAKETMQQPHNISVQGETWLRGSGVQADWYEIRFSVAERVAGVQCYEAGPSAKTLCIVRSPCFCNRPMYATAV